MLAKFGQLSASQRPALDIPLVRTISTIFLDYFFNSIGLPVIIISNLILMRDSRMGTSSFSSFCVQKVRNCSDLNPRLFRKKWLISVKVSGLIN